MAGTTGLEPATSDVTGRRSNQLNYVPAWCRVVEFQNITKAFAARPVDEDFPARELSSLWKRNKKQDKEPVELSQPFLLFCGQMRFLPPRQRNLSLLHPSKLRLE